MSNFEFIREKYPTLPGVYIMKDKEGEIIYVGKASSLRSRLSQYFGTVDSPKTQVLVSKIHSIEFVITKTEGEALILESNLIKNYKPKYNINLKDAKHYSYLAITDEEFPRLEIARKNSQGKFKIKAKRYFGPFVEGAKRAISARYLRKLFRIRICKHLPKKECLQYHLGNCDAPCIGKISKQDYDKNIESLSHVLEGKGEAKRILEELKKRMKAASNKEDFETAASIRDQMESLEIFFERQNVEKTRRTDEDFLFFQKIGPLLYVQELQSRNGVISGSQKHVAEIREQEEPEIAFCLQHYLALPDKVYCNLAEEQIHKLNSALSTDAFAIPGREKQKVLEIAQKTLTHGEFNPSVLELKKALSLEENPVIIETFDISTLFGEESVGSMVRFVNGKPDKSNYRKFIIKRMEGQDDFAMMKEVVNRRYSRLIADGGTLPDLILIDGGAGQLHAATDGMEAAGVRLPIISIAKKEEELYIPNRMDTLKLPKSSSALKLLQHCRDEAHRFAIGFHRKRRGKIE